MTVQYWKLLAGIVLLSVGCAGDPGSLEGDADSGDAMPLDDVEDATQNTGDDMPLDTDANGDVSDSDVSDSDVSDGDVSDSDVSDSDVSDSQLKLPDLPQLPDRPSTKDVSWTGDGPLVTEGGALDALSWDVREAGTDTGPPSWEAGVDAASDVREAGLDATSDVREAGLDATSDVREAGLDATSDVASDVREAGLDAPSDGGVPPDPVVYTGTLPIRTTGTVFQVRLTVRRADGGMSPRDVWVLMPRVLPPNAPLMLGFHGTNSDGATMLSESGASAVSDAQGVVFIAPTSRWFSETGRDFDHPGGNGTYWETANDPNPDTNEDLLLVRAIIQEARRAYGIDPTRVYAYGHSNGGFMAYMVSQVLRDRVVGFGSNAAGLSRCNPQQACRFQGRGTTCAALATQPGWCTCSGPELPVPVGATGRRTPGILFHGTADPLVSVYHTCTLDALMRARGNPVNLTLFDGGGHASFSTLASRVWTYLSAYRLGP